MLRLNSYISFKDNARDAMNFYKSVFGGNLVMTTFEEGGVPSDPREANNLMHAMLEADHGFVLMGADTPSGMDYNPGTNISMSLSGDDEETLTSYWNKLSEGANIDQPLMKAPWGDTFGMLTDKFKIHWMVNISPKKG